MSHTFAIGDIHGHHQLLLGTLERLRALAEPGDSLVFLGDYIDRGPDSFKVVETVLQLQRREGWDGPVITLMGNHEELLLDARLPQDQRDYDFWERVGGEETLDSYYEALPDDYRPQALFGVAGFPPEHLAFFGELELWHEDEHGIYVHAGIESGIKHPRSCSKEVLLWTREDWLNLRAMDYDLGKPIVFGHTPQTADESWDWDADTEWVPRNEICRIGIDTGAAYGGPLTAVMLPERLFHLNYPER